MILDDDLLALWEASVCEIRAEIKSYMYNEGCEGLRYAKCLCDALEGSMVSLANGLRKTYTFDGVIDIAEAEEAKEDEE